MPHFSSVRSLKGAGKVQRRCQQARKNRLGCACVEECPRYKDRWSIYKLPNKWNKLENPRVRVGVMSGCLAACHCRNAVARPEKRSQSLIARMRPPLTTALVLRSLVRQTILANKLISWKSMAVKLGSPVWSNGLQNLWVGKLREDWTVCWISRLLSQGILYSSCWHLVRNKWREPDPCDSSLAQTLVFPPKIHLVCQQ